MLIQVAFNKLKLNIISEQANITAVESNETSTTTTTEMVVTGELELSFMIYREKTNDSGKTFYEFQGYYTINPSATLD